jgi:hypothetical protein
MPKRYILEKSKRYILELFIAALLVIAIQVTVSRNWQNDCCTHTQSSMSDRGERSSSSMCCRGGNKHKDILWKENRKVVKSVFLMVSFI